MDNKNFNFPDDKIFQYITYGIVLAFILFNLGNFTLLHPKSTVILPFVKFVVYDL